MADQVGLVLAPVLVEEVTGLYATAWAFGTDLRQSKYCAVCLSQQYYNQILRKRELMKEATHHTFEFELGGGGHSPAAESGLINKQ